MTRFLSALPLTRRRHLVSTAGESSAITAKFVSIPPPTVFQELLRASVGARSDKP